MPDREKVIKGLECCMSASRCYKCPYQIGVECENGTSYYSKAIEDALTLLKEQKSIVHCKDCKYASLTSDGKLVKYCGQRDEGDLYLDADFFCADGVVSEK